MLPSPALIRRLADSKAAPAVPWRYLLPLIRQKRMAGREGLEPSNARSKAWCLTSLATAQRACDGPAIAVPGPSAKPQTRAARQGFLAGSFLTISSIVRRGRHRRAAARLFAIRDRSQRRNRRCYFHVRGLSIGAGDSKPARFICSGRLTGAKSWR